MALKLNFREVTPEDTEILRMIALRNGKAEDYLCCDVTNEDGVTQTTWYIAPFGTTEDLYCQESHNHEGIFFPPSLDRGHLPSMLFFHKCANWPPHMA